MALVGHSAAIGAWWATPLGFLLIDGGHADDLVRADEVAWLPHVRAGGAEIGRHTTLYVAWRPISADGD